jgi:hypothetical protein
MTPRRIDWYRVWSCLGCLLAAAAFWALVWLMLIYLPR